MVKSILKKHSLDTDIAQRNISRYCSEIISSFESQNNPEVGYSILRIVLQESLDNKKFKSSKNTIIRIHPQITVPPHLDAYEALKSIGKLISGQDPSFDVLTQDQIITLKNAPEIIIEQTRLALFRMLPESKQSKKQKTVVGRHTAALSEESNSKNSLDKLT